jgi:hypothetical protein
MEQLLQRIQTSYEMVKDAESKLKIIELLLSATDAIQNLTKDQIYPEMSAKRGGKRRTERQSDGYLIQSYYGCIDKLFPNW